MTRSSETGVRSDWWWIFDPRCSLPARASLIFGGGAVLFTVLIAWIGGGVYRRQLHEQLGFTFETLAVQVSDKIDRVIWERHHELQFVGGLAPFRDGGSPAEQRRILASLLDVSPDYAWIGFADSTGKVIAATDGRNEGTQVEQRSWFREAREQPFASGPVAIDATPVGVQSANEHGRSRVMEVAVPVSGSNLEFAGVLAAQLSWDWATAVQLSVVPETARRQLLGVTIYGSPTNVLLDSGGSGWTAPPDAPAVPMSGRSRGTMIEVAEGGTTYLIGYMRSHGFGDYPGLGWLTTVRQPIERALAPARDFQLIIARWGFAFSLLFFLLGWVLGANLARRIRAVTAAARRIHSGDILSMMPRQRGQLEVDEMCGAVADLVENLREKPQPDSRQAPPPPRPSAPGYERPTGTDPRRVIW
ncbi:MAG: cache domain-containing protein [Opitutus sp.]